MASPVCRRELPGVGWEMPGSSSRGSHKALAWYRGCGGDQAALPWEVRKKRLSWEKDAQAKESRWPGSEGERQAHWREGTAQAGRAVGDRRRGRSGLQRR